LDASFTLPDLTELEHHDNLKQVHLHCFDGPCVKDVLLMLKSCTHLRQLTLETRIYLYYPPLFATLEELCDFIMGMKHLTLLHIICRDSPYCDHFKSEVDGIKDFVLPLRPNFKFYISCCHKFDESRVSSREKNKLIIC
jgi:hypothetical protein